MRQHTGGQAIVEASGATVQEVLADSPAAHARAEHLAAEATRASPTAMAAFKQAVLASVGQAPNTRVTFEDDAYQHCVRTGQPAIGRAHFSEILAGKSAPWTTRVPFNRVPSQES